MSGRTARGSDRSGNGSGPGAAHEDETVVARGGVPVDETVVAFAEEEVDATVVALAEEDVDATVVAAADPTASGRARPPEQSRSITGDPAPPVPEPEPAGLPPALAARMFKSPLDTRHRVPAAPTGAPEHALPRRGISPGLPVVTATRTGLRPAPIDASIEQRLGRAPDAAPPPPAAPRDGLRSVARADRRFGAVALVGFTAALVCSVLGLWGVAVLAFG